MIRLRIEVVTDWGARLVAEREDEEGDEEDLALPLQWAIAALTGGDELRTVADLFHWMDPPEGSDVGDEVGEAARSLFRAARDYLDVLAAQRGAAAGVEGADGMANALLDLPPLQEGALDGCPRN